MQKEKQSFVKILILKLIIATLILSAFILAKHLFVQTQITKQMNISNIINEAGRQRMLSQRITKDILYSKEDEGSRDFYLKELETSLLEIERIHLNL